MTGFEASVDGSGRDPAREELLLKARRVGEEAIGLLETDAPEALDLVRRAEASSEAAGSAVGRGWRLQIEGWLALDRDDMAAARDRFDGAVAIAEVEKDDYSLVKGLNGLAAVYCALDLLDRALDIYRRALSVAKGMPDEPQLATVIGGNIGGLLHELGDSAGAVPYLREALEIGTSNPSNTAVQESLLGFCLADLGQPEDAEALIRSAIARCAENGYESTECITRGKFGKILLAWGRVGEAMVELRSAIAVARRIQMGSGEAEFLVTLARALRARGRRSSARRALARAIRLATESDQKIVLGQAIGALAESRAQEGHWKEAYRLSIRKSRIEEGLFKEKIGSQTNALRSERTEAEAEALRALYRRLSTISEIGRAVAAATDVDSVCRVLHSRIASLLPAEVFGVALYLPETDELDFRYFVDSGFEVPRRTAKVDPETTLSGWCVRNRKEIVLGDVAKEHGAYTRRRTSDEGPEMRSLIYYPVIVKGEPVAVVTVQSRSARQFAPWHLEILKTLGAYVGIALENARLFEELRALAVTDPLTGCMNRRRFMESADREIERAIRYGPPFALVMLDLDHFKSVNDTWGHSAGDLVLVEVVGACRKHLRTTDFIGRWGGEEFVVGIPGTDIEGAVALAERLRQEFHTLAVASGAPDPIKVTASFGAAAWRGDPGLQSLLTRADAALYRAKDLGRDRVEAEEWPPSQGGAGI